MTPEQLEEAKSRDERFLAVDLGLEVRQHSAPKRLLGVLLSKLEAEAEAAMSEFASVSSGETNRVMALQVRVKSYLWMRSTLLRIVQQGEIAETSLRESDRPILDE